MNLLSKLNERWRSRLSPKERIERQHKLQILIKVWVPRLSFLLYFVAVGWLLLLPSSQYNKETYVSENALLPAQVNVYYGWNDINAATEYRGVLVGMYGMSSEERAKYIEKELRLLAYRSATQHYINHDFMGVNAFGIFQAPRSDGTEAIVLSAPWWTHDGQQNVNGISVLLSLAKMFTRHTYWSKDIIILVSDGGAAGTQAWLQAYHGLDQEKGSVSSPVMPRSGVIQGAVNLEFAGMGDYSKIGILFEGINSQLPNLDLINTVAHVCHYTVRIPYVLHATDIALETDNEYLRALGNMLQTAALQALGRSSGEHGLYLRYKIDAITLYGIREGPLNFGLHRVGALVESTFRSLNNLLEHFHQSFFFYFLASPTRYVSIAMYMPPVILFACSLVFQALVLWAIAGEEDEEESLQDKETIRAYSIKERSIAPTLGVLLVAQLGGLAGFWVLTAKELEIFGDKALQFRLILSVALSYAVIFVIISIIRSRPTSNTISLSSGQDWVILKAVSLSYAALTIVGISPINFSLAVLVAIVVTIPYSFTRPTISLFGRFIQAILLTTLSPPGILCICGIYLGRSVEGLMEGLLNDYEILGIWLVPFLYCFYWPVNMALYGVVFAN